MTDEKAEDEEKYAHLEDADLIEKFKDCMKKHDEIRDLTEKVYATLGVSGEGTEEFLKNPDNFDKKQWESIQVARKEMEEGLLGGLANWKADVEKGVATEVLKKKEKPKRKRKVGKKRFLGQRKGWISLD